MDVPAVVSSEAGERHRTEETEGTGRDQHGGTGDTENDGCERAQSASQSAHRGAGPPAGAVVETRSAGHEHAFGFIRVLVSGGSRLHHAARSAAPAAPPWASCLRVDLVPCPPSPSVPPAGL